MPPKKSAKKAVYAKTSRKDARGRVVYTRAGSEYIRRKSAQGTIVYCKRAAEKSAAPFVNRIVGGVSGDSDWYNLSYNELLEWGSRFKTNDRLSNNPKLKNVLTIQGEEILKLHGELLNSVLIYVNFMGKDCTDVSLGKGKIDFLTNEKNLFRKDRHSDGTQINIGDHFQKKKLDDRATPNKIDVDINLYNAWQADLNNASNLRLFIRSIDSQIRNKNITVGFNVSRIHTSGQVDYK